MVSLQDLRERAHVLQKKADRKVKQIAAGTYHPRGTNWDLDNGKYGVDISGTKYDPRRSNIDRMTRRQVEAHIERLENFNSNVVGYYRGARKGDIISKQAMAAAYNGYRKHNRWNAAEHEEIGGTPVPGMGDITVQDYDHDFRPRRAYLDVAAGPTYTPKRMPVPTRYQDDAGAIAAGERMKEMHTTRGRKKYVDNARSQITKMIDSLDDPGFLPKILELNDERLWFLWTSSSKFAATLSEIYFAQKAVDEPGSQADLQFEEAIINSVDEHKDSLMQMYEEAANVEFKPTAELAEKRRREKRKRAYRKGLRTKARNKRNKSRRPGDYD